MERDLQSEELVNDAEVSSLTVQNGGDVVRRLANFAALVIRDFFKKNVLGLGLLD